MLDVETEIRLKAPLYIFTLESGRASVAVCNIPFHRDDSNAIVNQPIQLFVLIGKHRDLQFSTVVDKVWTTLIFVRGEQLLVERPTDVMQNNTRFWRTQNGRHTLLLLALPIASCCGGLYCTPGSYDHRT